MSDVDYEDFRAVERQVKDHGSQIERLERTLRDVSRDEGFSKEIRDFARILYDVL
jgi:hypothetical protein